MRLGFGTGFGLNNIIKLGGGTEIFNANVANVDGTQKFLSTITQTSNFTVLMRVNLDAIGVEDIIANNYLGGTGGWILYVTATGNLKLGLQNGVALHVYTGTETLTAGQDHLVGFSYNGTSRQINLIVDGVSSPFIGHTDGVYTHNALQIGGAYFATYMDGSIWDYEQWDRDLVLATEVQEVYNEGTTRCFALYQPSLKLGCALSVPLYNYTGFIGQERIDQSGNGVIVTNPDSIPFTGTAQIECDA